jgi:nucleotide-binding universal stress UspA family protein
MIPIRTILHPTDFSEPADHAFHLACVLARTHDARLLVLHVAPPPVEGVPRSGDYPAELWEQLRQIQPREPGVRIDYLLRQGAVDTEILHVARESRCDLIVMGTHGWARGERLLMGSVALSLFSHAPCLLLIVRPPFPHIPPPAEGVIAEEGV